MKFIKSKKGFVLLAALVVAVASAVGAYAYFTSTGNGTGSATVGTSDALTVTPTNVAALSYLYPGGAAYAVDGSVSNSGNNSPQYLHRLDAAIQAPTGVAGTFAGNGHPDCTAADFALTSGAGWVIDTATTAHLIVNTELATSGGGASYAWSGLNLGMVNRSDASVGDDSGNQDNCQGATANVKFTAS